MERELFNETNVKSFGYSEQLKILEIEFQSGAIYEYYDIPIEVYQNFLKAISKDSYFKEYIYDSEYKYKLRKKRNLNAQTIASIAGGAVLGNAITPGVGAIVGGILGGVLSIASTKESKDE